MAVPELIKKRYTLFLLSIIILSAFLLNPLYASATDEEPESGWDMFRDVATDEFYSALDDQFSQFSGVGVKDKIDKINESIETAQNFLSYFNDVLGAEPTRKADIEALNGLADGIAGITDLVNKLPEPGPSLASFFTFYAEGIRAAAAMMGKLSESLRQKAIEAAELGNWNFSLYPGAISDEEIAAIRRMKEQEQLARRAKARVSAKIAHLQAKSAQIQAFTDTGYAAFIASFVAAVETQAHRERPNTLVLDRMTRTFKSDYDLVFETTVPRDALEEQYTGEIDTLLADGRAVAAHAANYWAELRKAEAFCNGAENALDLVADLPDRPSDAALRSDLAAVRADIDELRNRSVTFEGAVSTPADAEGRFSAIADAYTALLAEAEAISGDAATVRDQAITYKNNAIHAWEDAENEQSGQVGTPCGITVSLGNVETLGANAATEVLLGYPEEAPLSISIPTVVVKQVMKEVDENGQAVLRRYFRIEAGANIATATMSVDKWGVVSVSSGSVRGVKAGTTTVLGSVQGYQGAPAGGDYTPEEYYAFRTAHPLTTLEDSVTVNVHEFIGLRFLFTLGDRGEVEGNAIDLFTTDNASLFASNSARIITYCQFMNSLGSLYEMRPDSFSAVTEVVHSDAGVVPSGSWYSNYAYDVSAGSPGTCDLAFTLKDGDTPVYSQSATCTVNHVTLHVGGSSDPSAWGAQPSDIVPLLITVEGDADLGGYECDWVNIYAADNEAALNGGRTGFQTGQMENELFFPTQATTDGRLRINVYQKDMRDEEYQKRGLVFGTDYTGGADVGIHLVPPELTRLELHVKHERNGRTIESPVWRPDLEALSSYAAPSIHLFNWGAYQPTRPIDIVERGYYTESLTPDVAEIFQDAQREQTAAILDPEAPPYIYKNTMVWPDEVTLSVERYNYTDEKVGQCTVTINAPAGDSPNYYCPEGIEGVNSLVVYADRATLERPRYGTWEFTAGRVAALRIDVETVGILEDYEVLWSLDSDVGGLSAEPTDFVEEEEGLWYSTTEWAVPRAGAVSVRAQIRRKSSQVILGADFYDATIVADVEYGLEDAIAGLKMLCGLDPQPIGYYGEDIDADGHAGLAEAAFVLQKVAGMR